MPMYTIREITRLATILAGLIAPRLCPSFVLALPQLRLGYALTTPHLRLNYALASISCEHCRSWRNNPHCAPRHIIYYTNRFYDSWIFNYSSSFRTKKWRFSFHYYLIKFPYPCIIRNWYLEIFYLLSEFSLEFHVFFSF